MTSFQNMDDQEEITTQERPTERDYTLIAYLPMHQSTAKTIHFGCQVIHDGFDKQERKLVEWTEKPHDME